MSDVEITPRPTGKLIRKPFTSVLGDSVDLVMTQLGWKTQLDLKVDTSRTVNQKPLTANVVIGPDELGIVSRQVFNDEMILKLDSSARLGVTGIRIDAVIHQARVTSELKALSDLDEETHLKHLESIEDLDDRIEPIGPAYEGLGERYKKLPQNNFYVTRKSVLDDSGNWSRWWIAPSDVGVNSPNHNSPNVNALRGSGGHYTPPTDPTVLQYPFFFLDQPNANTAGANNRNILKYPLYSPKGLSGFACNANGLTVIPYTVVVDTTPAPTETVPNPPASSQSHQLQIMFVINNMLIFPLHAYSRLAINYAVNEGLRPEGKLIWCTGYFEFIDVNKAQLKVHPDHQAAVAGMIFNTPCSFNPVF